MNWHFWIHKFAYQFCLAKGLSPLSMKAYYEVLIKFSEFMEKKKQITKPEEVTGKVKTDKKTILGVRIGNLVYLY